MEQLLLSVDYDDTDDFGSSRFRRWCHCDCGSGRIHGALWNGRRPLGGGTG